jgi:hypothetical protein
MLFSLADAMLEYLWWNVVAMNVVWAAAIFYRRVLLRRIVGHSQELP